MARLDDEQRQQLKTASADAAAALVEDLEYMRQLIAGTPNPADIRRLSALLRRILVERDLELIAAPRVGRIKIPALDLKPIHKADVAKPFILVCGAIGKLYGVEYGSFCLSEGNFNSDNIGFDPSSLISLKLDSFLKQRVLSFQGSWVTRSDVIKYVANVAQGVHSGSPRTDEDRTVARIRSGLAVSLVDGQPKLTINQAIFSDTDVAIRLDKSHVDCALLVVFGTAYNLVESAEVQNLEKAIIADF
ncbi:hypothetical protein JNB84_03265 [Rhizobium pusense]|uniref:hypothetical protein n=1 Tax=Agrobacterium pusense TaxID=648995 RepID=UPI001C6E004C|nr:hypothetical protein [Agrobacterium pusense]MBW9076960.1 hypothetical protein [Agrobacterium pusense]